MDPREPWPTAIETTPVPLSRMGGGHIASIVAGVTLSPLGVFALALPATAHPSDFETLTLDFLVGPRGLEVIDAAVVESRGPSYQPFPTSEFKHEVAVDVLEALDVPLSDADIDAELSERYHEVGFLVRFKQPVLGAESPLSIDTAGLQRIVGDSGLRRLKLSLCGVTDGAASADPSTLSEFDIQASQGGVAGLGRAACQAWVLAPTDQSVSIVVKPRDAVADTGSEAGADTGGEEGDAGPSVVWVTVATLAVLIGGTGLVAIALGLRRRTRPASGGARQ